MTVSTTLPVLTTERLTLTPVAVSDFDDLFTLWRDPVFTEIIAHRGPMSEEEVWFRLLRDIGHRHALGCGNWALRLKETGAYVGSVGVLDYRRGCVPPLDAPELGWGVGGVFQGKGLAREGLDAALVWADTTFDVPRTVCMINPDNASSLKLAERTGYRPYADGTYYERPVVLLERLRA